jgi:hypothetical protein
MVQELIPGALDGMREIIRFLREFELGMGARNRSLNESFLKS